MAEIWEYFKSLFNQAETSSPSKPLVHEIIERSEEELSAYEHWKKTLVSRRLIDWLRDQYAIFQLDPSGIDESLDFLNTSSSKGFVIHFHKTNYSLRDVTFLLDYFKEKVQGLGYRIQVSDVRSYQRPDWVETVERHYLKPPVSGRRPNNYAISYGHPTAPAGKKIDQEFGNITIDQHLRDDKVHHLRFRADNYSDHKYEAAKDFRELMQLILA